MSKLKSYIQFSLDHSVCLSEIALDKPIVSCEPRFVEPSRRARGKLKKGLKRNTSTNYDS